MIMVMCILAFFFIAVPVMIAMMKILRGVVGLLLTIGAMMVIMAVVTAIVWSPLGFAFILGLITAMIITPSRKLDSIRYWRYRRPVY